MNRTDTFAQTSNRATRNFNPKHDNFNSYKDWRSVIAQRMQRIASAAHVDFSRRQEWISHQYSRLWDATQSVGIAMIASLCAEPNAKRRMSRRKLMSALTEAVC
eukprot:2117759-Amphidinium_carterae.1